MPAAPNPEIHVAPAEPPAKSRPRMSTRNRLLFFATGWLIVLMPFLFWWNTWFGRPLSDQQLTEYLHDEKKPRHIQHALVQLGERMSRGDASVKQWYPEAVRLANHPVVEVRNTDAWVMGQDTSGAGFHQALLQMLGDSSLTVRGNAALSLVRFGDATGRPQLTELLQPAEVRAPQAGTITDASTVGTAIRQAGMVAEMQAGSQKLAIRSPISGRLREVRATTGKNVAAGDIVAIVDPGTEQVWEALRALYLVGQAQDIDAVRPYERELPDIPDRIRQQALATEDAIRQRAAE